jgi:hypothetical protein
MIRKLQSGEYRLYSRKVNPKTGKRRNLGTFKSRAAARIRFVITGLDPVIHLLQENLRMKIDGCPDQVRA